VTGYGEQPARALGWGIGVLALFALLFTFTAATPVTFGAALLTSGSALLGHGYTEVPALAAAPSLVTMLTIVESACGTVLELLFILALARKTQG
jgi:hypothetical protein